MPRPKLNRQCGEAGCERAYHARGYCLNHYRQVHHKGSTAEARSAERKARRCKVNGCSGQYASKGHCSRHLWQIRQHGNVVSVAPLRRPHGVEPLAWMLRQVEAGGTDGQCWNYRGRTDEDGYGRIADEQGRDRLAHRLAWERLTGQVLAVEEHLHHRCNNRTCVRPGHLYKADAAEHARITASDRMLANMVPDGHAWAGGNPGAVNVWEALAGMAGNLPRRGA
ncbi:HNH endonuclease [Zhihengliuella halotolerans]|uniref:HNH endonuclease n=1 Tax=Zhihengliuella halotolerans TaxID=370736 RepID=UPI000C80C85D|nr:HNH endonuclease [Zhihengliuella halotolerans]